MSSTPILGDLQAKPIFFSFHFLIFFSFTPTLTAQAGGINAPYNL